MTLDLWGDPVERPREEVEVKKKKLTPFDYLNTINYSGTNLMEGEYTDDAIRQYVPFIVNKGLSQNVDTIMYANVMNMHPDLENKMQYEYLLYSIRKRKRYSKWAKPTENPYIDHVMQYYKYSRDKAEQAIKLLSSDQLSYIAQMVSEGGIAK